LLQLALFPTAKRKGLYEINVADSINQKFTVKVMILIKENRKPQSRSSLPEKLL
jgi:hypothetical protein